MPSTTLTELNALRRAWPAAAKAVAPSDAPVVALQHAAELGVRLSDAMAAQLMRDKLHLMDEAVGIIAERARRNNDPARLDQVASLKHLKLNDNVRLQNNDPHDLIFPRHKLNEYILALYQRLSEREPNKVEWATGVALARLRIVQNHGLWDSANRHIAPAMAILRPMARANPNNLDVQSALARALQITADLKARADQEGRLARGEELDVRRANVRKAPNVERWQHELALCLQRFGNLNGDRNLPDTDRAIAFEEATEGFDKLLAKQPNSALYRQQLAQVKMDYAFLLIHGHRMPKGSEQAAQKLYRQALLMRQRLLEEDRTDALRQAEVVHSFDELAKGSGQREASLREAIAYWRTLAARYPTEKEWWGLQIPLINEIGARHEVTLRHAEDMLRNKRRHPTEAKQAELSVRAADAKLTQTAKEMEEVTAKFLTLAAALP